MSTHLLALQRQRLADAVTAYVDQQAGRTKQARVERAAKTLNVVPRTVQQAMARQRDKSDTWLPNADFIGRFAQVAGVSADYLLVGRGELRPEASRAPRALADDIAIEVAARLADSLAWEQMTVRFGVKIDGAAVLKAATDELRSLADGFVRWTEAEAALHAMLEELREHGGPSLPVQAQVHRVAIALADAYGQVEAKAARLLANPQVIARDEVERITSIQAAFDAAGRRNQRDAAQSAGDARTTSDRKPSTRRKQRV